MSAVSAPQRIELSPAVRAILEADTPKSQLLARASVSSLLTPIRRWPSRAARRTYLRPRRRNPELGARTLSDLVNQAHALTPEEIALMWQTAPLRMPIPRRAT
jgi:hypothetical protein